jgi:ABC-type transporter Mla MlaB component
VLKLEGKVTEQWAALLDGECRAFLRHRKRLRLECASVSFLDARGVEVLKSLPLEQVTLIGAPEFVTELLQTGGRS